MFVTSEYTKRVFENSGVTASVVNVGLGFDSSSFYKKEVKGYNDPGDRAQGPKTIPRSQHTLRYEGVRVGSRRGFSRRIV